MAGQGGRCAIYFAPHPGSALALFGAQWLGYDAATGADVAQPVLAGLSPERLREITAEPRRYGFHATLKPPFAFAGGTDRDMLDQAATALARQFTAFKAPPLRLARVSGFLALTLSAPSPPMDQLAAACVRELDRFRAPPSQDEVAQRRKAGLSSRQEQLLQRWGYPYVMEEFRFHMTLTGRLDDNDSERVRGLLAPLVEKLCRPPLAVDALALFYQRTPAEPFRIVRRYPLAA